MVGDILSEGETVYGIVQIDGENLISQHIYYLGNNVIVEGGPNLYLYKNDKNNNNNLFTDNLNLDRYIKDTKQKKKNILYHLLTNKNTFVLIK